MVTTQKFYIVYQKLNLFKGLHGFEVAPLTDKRNDGCDIVDHVFLDPATETQLYEPTACYDARAANTSSTVD